MSLSHSKKVISNHPSSSGLFSLFGPVVKFKERDYSLFKSLQLEEKEYKSSTTPIKNIDIEEFISLLKQERFKEHTLKINAEPDFKKRNFLKGHLIGATIGGTFSYRRKISLIDESGYAPIDIDKLSAERTREIFKELQKDKNIILMFISPSGKGIKAIIKIPRDRENYKSYVIAYYYYISQKFNLDFNSIQLDKSTHDISRLVFIGFCKENQIHYNKKAIDWNELTDLNLTNLTTPKISNTQPQPQPQPQPAHAQDNISPQEEEVKEDNITPSNIAEDMLYQFPIKDKISNLFIAFLIASDKSGDTQTLNYFLRYLRDKKQIGNYIHHIIKPMFLAYSTTDNKAKECNLLIRKYIDNYGENNTFESDFLRDYNSAKSKGTGYYLTYTHKLKYFIQELINSVRDDKNLFIKECNLVNANLLKFYKFKIANYNLLGVLFTIDVKNVIHIRFNNKVISINFNSTAIEERLKINPHFNKCNQVIRELSNLMPDFNNNFVKEFIENKVIVRYYLNAVPVSKKKTDLFASLVSRIKGVLVPIDGPGMLMPDSPDYPLCKKWGKTWLSSMLPYRFDYFKSVETAKNSNLTGTTEELYKNLDYIYLTCLQVAENSPEALEIFLDILCLRIAKPNSPADAITILTSLGEGTCKSKIINLFLNLKGDNFSFQIGDKKVTQFDYDKLKTDEYIDDSNIPSKEKASIWKGEATMGLEMINCNIKNAQPYTIVANFQRFLSTNEFKSDSVLSNSRRLFMIQSEKIISYADFITEKFDPFYQGVKDYEYTINLPDYKWIIEDYALFRTWVFKRGEKIDVFELNQRVDKFSSKAQQRDNEDNTPPHINFLATINGELFKIERRHNEELKDLSKVRYDIIKINSPDPVYMLLRRKAILNIIQTCFNYKSILDKSGNAVESPQIETDYDKHFFSKSAKTLNDKVLCSIQYIKDLFFNFCKNKHPLIKDPSIYYSMLTQKFNLNPSKRNIYIENERTSKYLVDFTDLFKPEIGTDPNEILTFFKSYFQAKPIIDNKEGDD